MTILGYLIVVAIIVGVFIIKGDYTLCVWAWGRLVLLVLIRGLMSSMIVLWTTIMQIRCGGVPDDGIYCI